MQETVNIKSTIWSPEFIVDKRINKDTVTYSEISNSKRYLPAFWMILSSL